MNLKKYIPNFLTLLNLLAGCLAIPFIFKGQPEVASLLVGIALVLDFLDGFTARILKVKSDIGVQLDSLADLISFGLVPGFILYHYLSLQITNSFDVRWMFVSYSAFLLPLSAALRLAKFNIDKKQVISFKGLPTPATAIFIASLPLILQYQDNYAGVHQIIQNMWTLLSITVFFSIIQLLPATFISLKFKGFSWRENKHRYLIPGVSVALIVILKFTAFPLIIFSYIIYSFFIKNK